MHARELCRPTDAQRLPPAAASAPQECGPLAACEASPLVHTGLELAQGFTALFDGGERNAAASALSSGPGGRDAASVPVLTQRVPGLLRSPHGCPGFQEENLSLREPLPCPALPGLRVSPPARLGRERGPGGRVSPQALLKGCKQLPEPTWAARARGKQQAL